MSSWSLLLFPSGAFYLAPQWYVFLSQAVPPKGSEKEKWSLRKVLFEEKQDPNSVNWVTLGTAVFPTDDGHLHRCPEIIEKWFVWSVKLNVTQPSISPFASGVKRRKKQTKKQTLAILFLSAILKVKHKFVSYIIQIRNTARMVS